MQDPDPIVDLMSPLNSVDATSKDRMVVQEGKCLARGTDLTQWTCMKCPPSSIVHASSACAYGKTNWHGFYMALG